jgi:hypothetical protein
MALVSILAEEAVRANVQISVRGDFSAFYLKVLLASPELSAAYTALELAAFRRLRLPAATRQGKKISAGQAVALQRARTGNPRPRTHYSRSHSPPPPRA